MSSNSESESESNARGRVKKLMDEIYSQRDNLKTDADVDKMADQCTKMLVDMIDRAKGKGSSSKVKKSATNPPAEKDLGLGMPLKDYARRRDRPDFEKIYKGRVDDILKGQAKNKEWRSKTGEPSSASSLTSSGSDSASGSSEEENDEVRDPLAGGDFAGRRDFDAMKKKAEEWLKKHEVDMGGFSSSGDDDPALLSKLARPLQNLLRDQPNAARTHSKPQPDKASTRRTDYPASLKISSSSKPSTSFSSSRKPPPSSTTSKTTSKKPTKKP